MSLRLLLGCCAFSLAESAAEAAPYIIMFESDADRPGGQEVAFRFYDSFDNLLTNTASRPDLFSPLNVSADFSTRGLAFGGMLGPPTDPGDPPPPTSPLSLPASVWMVFAGLGCLGLFRRRQRMPM